jgi:PKD repeat protein
VLFDLVAPGNYVVGLQESVSQNISVATNTDYYVPGLAWVFFNGSWSNNEDFSFFNTYLISANFGPSCPTVAAAFTESTNGLAVNFTDASTNNDAWLWDFGDGNTSTAQNPTHTYATDGTYTVCLIAASNCDADTVCTTITVTNCVSPVVNFTETMSAGGVVDFTNGSTTTGTATYSWDFGDGQTATTENPTNTYAANGTYTVCLTVTDSCGSNTTCNNITVNTIGIDEQSLIESLSIFPIPAQEMMTISNLTSGEDFTLELLNNLGQVVKIVRTNGLESVQLDLSNVVDGYYHLRISNATAIGTRAVVIKH